MRAMLMATVILAALCTPARADKIIGSFNQNGDCECTCTPGPCPASEGPDAHAIAVCRAACAPCAAGCPRPLAESCHVGRDPRWKGRAVLKCRSVFALPR